MKALVAILLVITALSIFSCAYALNEPYNVKVKELYASPGSSKVVYSIPIDVKMLDVTEDANWYKVYLRFNLGPVEFKYVGWAYIPGGDILAERAVSKAKIATSSE